VHRDEESAQTIISGMGELHLEIYIERMKREYRAKSSPASAGGLRETITQRRVLLHPQEADRRLGPFARGVRATSIRCPRLGRALSVVDDVTGGSIPREFIPACDKGFHEAIRRGR